MIHVVIAGASGVVGARALDRLLAHKEVARVTALGRRALPQVHPRLNAKVADLQRADALVDAISDAADLAVCCLGTTLKQAGSPAAFRAVDHDAVLAFAHAAQRRGAARFLLISSLGADAASRNLYLQTKGQTEAEIAALGFPQLTILRPSLIDDQGARADHRLGERVGLTLGRAAFALLGRERRYAPITADRIAAALVHLAFDHTDDPVRVIQSDRLHALARA
jgi:uncharacterized protein YbjT (DUF2867 family)